MPIPSVIGLFDTSTGMRADATPDDPVSDGIFGQLLLLGVGRILAPFALAAKLLKELW